MLDRRLAKDGPFVSILHSSERSRVVYRRCSEPCRAQAADMTHHMIDAAVLEAVNGIATELVSRHPEVVILRKAAEWRPVRRTAFAATWRRTGQPQPGRRDSPRRMGHPEGSRSSRSRTLKSFVGSRSRRVSPLCAGNLRRLRGYSRTECCPRWRSAKSGNAASTSRWEPRQLRNW